MINLSQLSGVKELLLNHEGGPTTRPPRFISSFGKSHTSIFQNSRGSSSQLTQLLRTPAIIKIIVFKPSLPLGKPSQRISLMLAKRSHQVELGGSSSHSVLCLARAPAPHDYLVAIATSNFQIKYVCFEMFS